MSPGFGLPASLLADEQQLGVRAGALQRLGGDQAVVQDRVGPRDQLQCARRQQAGIAGAGADEEARPFTWGLSGIGPYYRRRLRCRGTLARAPR